MKSWEEFVKTQDPTFFEGKDCGCACHEEKDADCDCSCHKKNDKKDDKKNEKKDDKGEKKSNLADFLKKKKS